MLTSIGATLAVGALTRARGAQIKEKIAILGTGRLGEALARCWVRTGHPIIFGSRTPDAERVQKVVKDIGAAASVATPGQAAAQAEIVVFALPWKAVPELMPSTR